MILLDTNVAVAVLRGRPPSVRERLRVALEAGDVVTISSVVLFELRHGAARSASPARNHARVEAFLAGRIEVVPFTQGDADEAGELRAELERAGSPIGAYDVLIAGQARRHARHPRHPRVRARRGAGDRGLGGGVGRGRSIRPLRLRTLLWGPSID